MFSFMKTYFEKCFVYGLKLNTILHGGNNNAGICFMDE